MKTEIKMYHDSTVTEYPGLVPVPDVPGGVVRLVSADGSKKELTFNLVDVERVSFIPKH